MVNIPSDAVPPRLCVIEKLNGETEYGYNLHAEKGRGQFVGIVDANSPAERGGLITGDRIFAVNGHSIIGENHKKVVERIKANPNRCEMLVISEEGAKWYQEHNVQITLDLPNIERVSQKNHPLPPSIPPPQRPSNHSPPPSSWYAPTTYSQLLFEKVNEFWYVATVSIIKKTETPDIRNL
ncbi:unnamed protein product [Caenorhabditis nigoni]